MFRTPFLISILSITVVGCQSESPRTPLSVPDAAAKCSTEIKKREPRSKVEVTGWTQSRTAIYGSSGPALFTVDNQEKLIELPYVKSPNDKEPGQAWRICMLQAGYDTTKMNLKL